MSFLLRESVTYINR